MYCKKCGSRIDENTGLCPICDAEQKYSNLKKVPEPRQNGVPNQPTVNSNGYANLKKPEQNAQASPVQPPNPVQQPAQPNVPPVIPIAPVPPVTPAQPAYTPQPVRDVSGWSKKDIKALDRAEKIESRNRSTKIKNAIFKALAVVLACIISMTAVTGVFVYYDKLDIPAYSNVLDYIGLKQTAVPASKTTSTNNGNSDNSGNENNDNGGSEDKTKTPTDSTKAFVDVDPVTDDEVEQHNKCVIQLESSIKKVEKTANKQYPDLQPEDVESYLDIVGDGFEDLKSDGTITDYTVNSSNIKITLSDGSYYFYMPDVDGVLGSTYGENSLRVATYQPGRTEFIKDGVSEQSCQKPDDAAKLISDSVQEYYFDDIGTETDCNYDDSEVTIDNFLGTTQDSVIVWEGHGCYDDSTGNTFIVLGLNSEVNISKGILLSLLRERVIIQCTGGVYAVGGEFINKYVPDGAYQNSLIYLGICSGGRNGEDNLLISSLLAKGAGAVYAFDNIVHTTYAQSSAKSIAEALCTKNGSDDRLQSAQTALEYSKEQNGEYDKGFHNWSFFKTSLVLFGNTEYTLDWFKNYNFDANRDVVMVLDTSGSMSGEPLDQTRIAANNFIKTVLDESQANIGLVDYNSGATVDCEFSSNATKLHDVVNSLECGGGTDIESGLNAAATMLSSGKAEKKIIVLMSDGCANEGKCDQELIDYASTLKSKGIYIYTLGFFNALSESEKTSAQVVMDGIASEGCHYEVDDANNLVYFFDDIANQINGTRYIYVKIACPVDVTVKYDGETLSTAKENQTRTSFGTLTYLNAENSKNEEYDFNSENEGDEDKIKMLRLKEGVDYDIQIKGYDDGEMDYSIGFMDENGEYSDFRDFEGINITKKTVIDTKAQVSDTTTLKVDEDGDGKYDYTMKANANSFGKVVKVSKLVVATIFVTGGAVLIISIAIALSKRKKRKALIKRAYKTTKTA